MFTQILQKFYSTDLVILAKRGASVEFQAFSGNEVLARSGGISGTYGMVSWDVLHG